MTTQDDLIARLRAQLDEDEQFAAEASQSPWRCEDNFVENLDGGTVARFEIEANARFAAANDPARELRDIAAKRKIVELCATETDETGGRPLAIRILRLLADAGD
jgi:hypothetical protein